MSLVGLNLLPGNTNNQGSVNDLKRLGRFLDVMAQANTDQGLEDGPIVNNLLKAEHWGERVVKITQRLNK